MKNLLIILTAVFLIVNTFLPWQASAQSPEKMKYQAVIRDSNGHVVTNQAIGMQISILQGDLPGTVVYTETQSLLSNTLGLTSTEIGTGTVVLGDFSTIDWANGPYFLQIETDPTGGTNYTVTGTNQLLSVPYSMHAKTADSLTNIDSFSWSTTGNTGTNDTTNFIGTIDNVPLVFKVNNVRAGRVHPFGYNTSFGYNALNTNFGTFVTAFGRHALSVNTGNYNTAIGYVALKDNTSGSGNTASGRAALHVNTTGSRNTAIGNVTLANNETGDYNTAIGSTALYSNIVGSNNTATGYQALYNNTQSNNTANGYLALFSNTIGVVNTATGNEALYNNTTGNHNTAIGGTTLYENTSGQRNTGIGSGALNKNETGNDNTAIGFTALNENLDGDDNTAIGRTALSSNLGDENTAIGRSALYYNTSGNQNTAVGRNALVDNTNGSNNTGIGFDAQVPSATLNNQVRVGNTSVFYAGVQVAWSITSDKAWKEQIRVLPYGLDMIMQLKPVDYYRKNSERKTREMGFIAQDVEVLLKEMGYDDQGFLTKADNGNLSLRYNDFIALLTKGMQEQQEMIDQQKTLIEELISRIEKLENNNY